MLPDTIVFPENSPRQETDPAIIGGQRVQPGEIPFQALLLTYMGSSVSYCGGSLVHPNWVLTAAHCISGQSTRSQVRMGGTNIKKMAYVQWTEMRIPHERYNPNTFENDVALYRIPAPANNLGLSLVEMAPPNIGTVANQPVRISGFGFINNQGPVSDDLLRVNLRTISNQECRNSLGKVNSIFESTICAMWSEQQGQSACHGDSGGPLVYNQNGKLVQVGVVSWGLAMQCSRAPTAYARVSSFRTWIDRTMAANSRG